MVMYLHSTKFVLNVPGHCNFLGGGGVLKAKSLEALCMKINWNFLGGGGVQNKNLLWGEYGYFLELYDVLYTSS